MNADELTAKILAAPRPGGWEEIGNFRFYVEAMSQLDYQRIRAAAVDYTVEDGETVQHFDTHRMSLGWLTAVTDWDAVTAGDFHVQGLEDADRRAPVPFSRALLLRLLANRAEVMTELVARIVKRHREYVKGEAEDEKNSPGS